MLTSAIGLDSSTSRLALQQRHAQDYALLAAQYQRPDSALDALRQQSNSRQTYADLIANAIKGSLEESEPEDVKQSRLLEEQKRREYEALSPVQRLFVDEPPKVTRAT